MEKSCLQYIISVSVSSPVNQLVSGSRKSMSEAVFFLPLSIISVKGQSTLFHLQLCWIKKSLSNLTKIQQLQIRQSLN